MIAPWTFIVSFVPIPSYSKKAATPSLWSPEIAIYSAEVFGSLFTDPWHLYV